MRNCVIKKESNVAQLYINIFTSLGILISGEIVEIELRISFSEFKYNASY